MGDLVVKRKPFWLSCLTLSWGRSLTIGQTIYIAPKTYGQLHNRTGHQVVAHEKVHAKQFSEFGTLSFLLLYIFVFPFCWNPWRREWEAEAFAETIKWRYTRYGYEQGIRHYAGVISSWKYGWCSSYNAAYRSIRKYLFS